MSANGRDDVLDDNKLDFELLTRRHRDQRRRSSASGSSSTLAPSEVGSSTQSLSSVASETNTDLIWPLHLKPTFINHYITGEIIGHGSYAEVRECVDMRTLERCAMKIINRESLAKQAPRALTNQLQEIRLLRRFRHANIVSMRECLVKGGYVYIILEYCPLNMDQLLSDQVDGKFHVSVGRRFFFQLCHAVSHLHSLGIVHRDIKPQNMLLTNSGRLKLIDFGVSQVLSMWDRSELCNNYEGSPLFQAPEIVSGGRKYNGFKADIWSCGITLFLMLYGRFPFMDEALLGLYDKILGEDLAIPQCPPTSMALTDLLVLMLEKDCANRASIERVLEHPWMRLLGAANECDELMYSEFFDLVIKRHDDQQRLSQIRAASYSKDMYKSMTVLPFLYQHHFPHLPIKKTRRSGSVPNEIITKVNSLNSDSVGAGRPEESVSKDSSKSSSTTSSPHEILDHDEQQIEWGTEEQYHLLRVPQIRANRIRCGASSKLKSRDKMRVHKDI